MREKAKDIAALLDEPDTTIAVVGATDDPAKYGSVIYRDLKRKGYTVYPVNPNRNTVDGDPAFATLADLPVKPTIVNFVVPPPVTLKILRTCLEMGLKNVWLQPGAESPAVLRFLQENGFNYLANACIMVQSRHKVA
ncbi:MAG: CoA-binding protein [Calditrichaeota bacterium]|nr:MAG: CoA-binding protein [Calditrichota bacterium]